MSPTHEVTISVNERPVTVEGPRITGREIKMAAIAQGVPIQADFVLTEERPHGPGRVIGDDDVVTVHPGSRFTAIAPDDNS